MRHGETKTTDREERDGRSKWAEYLSIARADVERGAI